MELSNLDERNLWGWLSSNSRLAHLRPLLAGLDGSALVGATVTELGELGIAAIHARLLLRAIEEEFGPQRPGGGGIVDDAYLRAIEEEFGPSALAAAGSSTTPISAPSRRSSGVRAPAPRRRRDRRRRLSPRHRGGVRGG